MGPDQNPAKSLVNQGHRRAKRPRRRPRARLCLLKDCGKRFRLTRALARYCSQDCAAQGRRWSLWKAQQRYRETKHGRQKRQAQSCRYRQRTVHKGKKERCAEEARVITPGFFRVLVRSSRLLRPVLAHAPFAAAAILQPRVPARGRARPGAGAALARARISKPAPHTVSQFTSLRGHPEIVPTY
jgi:hypothetical protein